MLASKENIVKFQLAYSRKKERSDFSGMNILSFKQEGKGITLVVKDNIEQARKQLEKSNPILMEEIPVNFEELFIYEVENGGLK